VTASTSPRVHIILLNWNNSADTLECMDSVLRSDYSNYQIVVCDNASTDDSVERIRAWARGDENAPAIAEPLRHIMEPPRTSPAPFVEIDGKSAEQGGTAESRAARVLLIRNFENLGFAGGNNVALRYAVAAASCHPERSEGSLSMDSGPSVASLPQDDRGASPRADSFICLLNNDTVVTRDWMSRMMARIRDDATVGAVGAMLYEYYLPDLVESAGGGVVHSWQGMPRGTSAHRQRRGTPQAIPRRLDFLTGACTLMRTSTLEQIGLIDERYFIYCEDIDLSLRIRRAGLRLVLATDAEMWHKNGGIMSKYTARRDYYMLRNSLLLVHKLYPAMIPAALAFSVYRCVLPKIVRGQGARLGVVVRAYRDFFKFVGGNPLGAGVGESVPPRS
jgi:GT2 family glycosyltransferase